MRHAIGTLALFIGSGAVAWGEGAPAGLPRETVIERTYLHCVLDNAEALLEEPDDPVVFYLDLCLPQAELGTVIGGGTRLDLPSIEHSAADPAATTIPTLSISKAALRCLLVRSAAQQLGESGPIRVSETC